MHTHSSMDLHSLCLTLSPPITSFLSPFSLSLSSCYFFLSPSLFPHPSLLSSSLFSSLSSPLLSSLQDREHTVDLLPHLWMLDGRMITGKAPKALTFLPTWHQQFVCLCLQLKRGKKWLNFSPILKPLHSRW